MTLKSRNFLQQDTKRTLKLGGSTWRKIRRENESFASRLVATKYKNFMWKNDRKGTKLSCKLPLPSNECNGIVYFIGNLKKMLHFSSKLTRKENFDCSESDVRTTLCLHKCTWFWKFGKVLKCLLWLTVSCIRIKRVITPWSNFKVVDLRTPKSCLFFF